MDVASALGDRCGDGFAGAGAAVEDPGGGGELVEVFLNHIVETSVVAKGGFVFHAEVGPELLVGIHGLRRL